MYYGDGPVHHRLLAQCSLLIDTKVVGTDLVGRDQPVVSLGTNANAVSCFLEREESDHVFVHKLGADRVAHKVGKFRRTQPDVLSICTTLSLSVPPFACTGMM